MHATDSSPSSGGKISLETVFSVSQMQMLNNPDILDDKSAVSDLLEAFQPINTPQSFFQGMQLVPATGSIDYLYCGTYYFLEGVFDVGMVLNSSTFCYWF